jgi:streptogramin lyase
MKCFSRVAGLALPIVLNMIASTAEPATSPIDLALVQTILDHEGDPRLDYAAVDSATHRLYVARGDGVMAVDLDSGKVTHQLVAGRHVHAVVPLPNGRVLSTNEDTGSATLFEGLSGHVIAEIATGPKPDAAVFDPASGLVLVMDEKDGEVTFVDPVAGASSGRVAIGGKLQAAVADGHGRVFVNVEDQGEVAVLDTAARKVIARYALPGCHGPSGLGLNPESGLLLAACDNRVAVAIRATDGSAVPANLPIDRHPDAVIFDPMRKVFFVPCGRDGTLPVIAESKGGAPSVVAKLDTAVGAHTGAVDSKSGRLYLPTADYHLTLSGIEAAAGTFRILVFAARR